MFAEDIVFTSIVFENTSFTCVPEGSKMRKGGCSAPYLIHQKLGSISCCHQVQTFNLTRKHKADPQLTRK